MSKIDWLNFVMGFGCAVVVFALIGFAWACRPEKETRKCRSKYCARNLAGHEPVPAEQPRPSSESEVMPTGTEKNVRPISKPVADSDNRASDSTASLKKSGLAVAASPAEGPRQPEKDELDPRLEVVYQAEDFEPVRKWRINFTMPNGSKIPLVNFYSATQCMAQIRGMLREAATQPVPGTKVEEIAAVIANSVIGPLLKAAMSDKKISLNFLDEVAIETAAILRPYFPQDR